MVARAGTGRRTPTAEVRSALVDAAVAVLERDGLAGLTVRAVAAEAGVAPMGVYNHLDGKAGLVTAVLTRGFDALRSAVEVPASLPAGERMTESGRGYRRFALASPTTYGLMFNRVTDPGAVDLELLVTHAAPAFVALVDIVIAGQQAGTVRAGVPEQIARQIWATVHGGVSLELAQEEIGSPGADEAYEQLLELITRGIAPD